MAEKVREGYYFDEKSGKFFRAVSLERIFKDQDNRATYALNQNSDYRVRSTTRTLKDVLPSQRDVPLKPSIIKMIDNSERS